jgi:hypothetical protein
MASIALEEWNRTRSSRLDELEQVHRGLTGNRRGRQWVTDQLDRAYLLVLASQFQGFCRDLHSEAAATVASRARPEVQSIVEANLTLLRQLDRGNAGAGTLGTDFGRLGFDLWPAAYAIDMRNARRREMLDQLMVWRNSIAHDSAISSKNQLLVAGTRPTMTWGKRWRRGLGALAAALDGVVAEELSAIIGTRPW